MTSLLLMLGFPAVALAKGPTVPRRQIPVKVLDQLSDLEVGFERALAQDCALDRCSSTGCVYMDHAVADRPRSGSLPGLGDGTQGPGSVAAQAWLTRAQCGYAHEADLTAADASALTRRLQARVSSGWTSVSVSSARLEALPEALRDPVVEEDLPEVDAVPPEPLTAAVAGEQLWGALLPHFFWMLGLGLVTVAGGALIWSWRRVGQATMEEQMLLAQLQGGGGLESSEVTAVSPDDPDAESRAIVAAQIEAWRLRLDTDPPDPAIQALIRERLRADDIPFLAKAVMVFPDRFPGAFPSGGDVATAKLKLADFIASSDQEHVLSDVDFFEALERYAVAAALATQTDAEIVRLLREDFGAAGLADLIGTLPPRLGAVLFSLAPPASRHDLVRLLSASQVAGMSQQLLLSNRMDPAETARLFAVLRGEALGDQAVAVSDRGATFDAAGALSVLLSALDGDTRAGLFEQAIARFRGTVPAWTHEIFVADMLQGVPAEVRSDLLLGVSVESLAAWLSVQDRTDALLVESTMPTSLRATVQSIPPLVDRDRQLLHAEKGRIALAQGLQGQIQRLGLSFEHLLVGAGAA